MYDYSATLDHVVDGDTVYFKVDLGFKVTTVQDFRLARINAPELSTPDGAAAKIYLEQKLIGNTITIKSSKNDAPIRQEKWRRWLCEIWLGDVNLNDHLVTVGYAVYYP